MLFTIVSLLVLATSGCTPAPTPSTSDAASLAGGSTECALPHAPDTILNEDGAVLLSWQFSAEEVFFGPSLPNDPAFEAYRAAVIRDGGDLRRPVFDLPIAETEAMAAIWRDEGFNNDLVYEEGIGRIEPITCLDALLFTQQAARVSQVEQPTEFLASVLERLGEDGPELVVVFGAGTEMFPPRSVYGFDVVDRYLEDGWSFKYALHNHTLQANGDRIALGVPVPSTSDVSLLRGLAEGRGLESARVTNGFYTFEAAVAEMGEFRAR